MRKRGRPLSLSRDVENEIIRLYNSDRGSTEITKLLGVGHPTVRRALRRRGVKIRSNTVQGTRCVDCGKKTERARRCPFHIRVRHAALNRETYREKRPYLDDGA